MGKLPVSIAIFTFLLMACSNNESAKQENGHQHDSTKISKDVSKKSIPKETIGRVGNTDVKFNYHSPAVRGRVIWGGLVPYDALWVTGAHNATTIEAGKDFMIGGKLIPAGKYAFFTIPGKEEWTIIINRNWNQHLTDDYSEAEDMARVKVKPQMTEEINERLKYEIDQTGERTATITISWEKVRVPFDIEIR